MIKNDEKGDGVVYIDWLPKFNMCFGRRISSMDVNATEKTSISVAEIAIVSVMSTSTPGFHRPNVLKIKNRCWELKKKYILH